MKTDSLAVQDDKELGAAICNALAKAESYRNPFEQQWDEIALLVRPTDHGSFQGTRNTVPGEQKTEYQFDATAPRALPKFATILSSLTTPRGEKWHMLTSEHPELQRDKEVQAWFEEVRNVLFRQRYAPDAGFARGVRRAYTSIGAYGTGCMFVDAAEDGTGLRYKAIPIGEVYFSENHQGTIDTAYRKFQFTARQAHQKWGDKLPDAIKQAADQEKEFTFIHCVRPNTDREIGTVGSSGMRFVSVYVAEAGKTVVEKGGYHTFPYAVGRYDPALSDVYGQSPAMTVLADIKTLNEQEKTMLKQGQKALDPVLLAYDDGELSSVNLRPGAINYGGVSADGRPLIHTLPTGDIAAGADLMEVKRASINDAFLITLFQILIETTTMTATEVLERTREKAMLLAPVIGQIQDEFLGSMVARELDLLARQNMLPPMPQALQATQGAYEVIYSNPMTRMMESSEAAGAMRTIESAVGFATATGDPSALDHFNVEVMVPELAQINGMPMRWLHSNKNVLAMRDQRAARKEQEMAIQAMPATASLISASAKAKTAGAPNAPK